MALLTANRPVPNTLQQRLDMAGGVVVDMVMTVSSTIYEGAFVTFAAGTGTITAAITTNVFAGIALKKVVSDGTAGSTKCPVYVGGYFTHLVASADVTSIGKVAFLAAASMDNVINLTETTSCAVGRVINHIGSNICVIKMKTIGEVSGAVGTTYTAGAL